MTEVKISTANTNAMDLPETFEFFDEKNIGEFENFITTDGRREKNPNGGCHGNWHWKTLKD